MNRPASWLRAFDAISSRRFALKKSVKELPVVGPVASRVWRHLRARMTKANEKPRIVPQRFLDLYKARNGIEDLDRVDDPLKKLHLDFALSTLARGTHVRSLVAQHVSLRGKKYLDVGCAYGGFLVSFMEGGVASAVGIDLDDRLLDYSRALVEDYDVKATIKNIDVLAESRVRELGRFDIITCNDVIEHVDDPRLALEHLMALLEDDGLLFMEIPNRHSASFVKSDGHFQLFGITSLPKKKADAYYTEIYPGQKHDVTYKSLSYYLGHLRRLGGECILVNAKPPDLEPKLSELGRLFAECEVLASRGVPRVSDAISLSVKRQVGILNRVYRAQYERYRALRERDPRGARMLGEKMITHHGEDFWTIVVRKRSSRAGV